MQQLLGKNMHGIFEKTSFSYLMNARQNVPLPKRSKTPKLQGTSRTTKET